MSKWVGVGQSGITHIARAWNRAGQVWKPGDGDYVDFVNADYVSYRIEANEAGASTNYFVDDADLPADADRWELCVQSGTLAGEQIVWESEPKMTFPTDLTTLTDQAADSVSLAGVLAAYYSHQFFESNFDAGGWQSFVFTLKRDKDTDEDENAILMIRVSSPASPGTDGIIIFNGRAVAAGEALRAKASLVVASYAPDTQINLAISAAAMVLPPSAESDPYDFSLDFFVDGEKKPFAAGTFALSRAALRATVSP